MNLAEGIDVAENENRIAEYQKANYQEILENQARQVRIGLPGWQFCMVHASLYQNGHSSIKAEHPAAIKCVAESLDNCIVVLWTAPAQDLSASASLSTRLATSISHLLCC